MDNFVWATIRMIKSESCQKMGVKENVFYFLRIIFIKDIRKGFHLKKYFYNPGSGLEKCFSRWKPFLIFYLEQPSELTL